MAKMKRLKENKLYYVKFLDHVCGDEDPVVVHFAGYFVKETKHGLVFSHWLLDDPKWRADNYELTGIIESCIFEIKELKSPCPLQ